MWNKLLTTDCVKYIQSASGDKEMMDKYGVTEHGEEERLIYEMFDKIKSKVKDYKVIVVMATQWDTYTGTQQANLAVHHIGLFHASRFIILMDYLSNKFKQGELN